MFARIVIARFGCEYQNVMKNCSQKVPLEKKKQYKETYYSATPMTTPGIRLPQNWILLFFVFHLTLYHMGATFLKCYSYKPQPNVFKLFLKFPPNGPDKTTFGIFQILKTEFSSQSSSQNYIADFCLNFEIPIFRQLFSKISHSSLYPNQKSQLSDKKSVL